MPFKIPTSVQIREKNSAIEFGEKKGGQRLRGEDMYVLVIQTRPVGFVPAPFSAYFDGTTMSVLRQKALILLKIVGCQSLQTPRSSATATLTMVAARRVRSFMI